ncbi:MULTISPECIES: pyrimidine-nucleoside phosphorylase [Limosilactobacillus]|uniref:Pyrimidine-nucleoside phosphorylase n=1 Tax=Limosilactobacillus mucosae TaxID=97478 RepID=A0A099YBA1_LIMMU|nr:MULTISPECIES: pyrimidine-nucleoside phosphorylase [Limosilactobacillus]KGL66697.1 thymidine phosphorylase [Limosilactobacillus mucosae]MCC6096692.1 pyrimidine-nucleoside phosphorylase [Limosilactobacillus sp.]VTZ91152.1 Pyrimidine-nucleoside phosphorylase [Limosilactobacillus mucosae]
MRMVDVIDQKRNGGVLSDEQLQFFVDGVVDGSLPDYQISALLMAIYFQGMTDREQTQLTMKMMHSGERLDLSKIPGIKVDKHSTGGVGDKTSLPLAAMVAALGIPVPMISGRGLGHTGGTLDKLEAIPGFQVELSEQDFIKQVAEEKLAIVGATRDVAPADKKIYALRDVTDTVDSIPLIASSIMSKKLASGTDALVIDVKTGAGAFMKTEDSAVKLAKALVAIGKQAGLKCEAVISDMNQPLGSKIGNTLEIEETLDLLKGKGPKDLLELVLELGSRMVVMGQQAASLAEARAKLEQTIADGSALARFKAMIKAQHGDPNVVDDYSLMPHAKYQIEYPAQKGGVIAKLTADEIGMASMLMGGGRQKADDQLDYAVGIELHKKIGDSVQKGESIMTIWSNCEDIDDVKELLDQAVAIKESAQQPTLIHETIE